MTLGKMLFLTVLSTVCLAGCGGSVKTSSAETAVLAGPNAEMLMAAAQETLGQMRFVLDKYDIEAGYLRTRPQRASQFFEPWRQDNASGKAFAQANIDSLRRNVEVFVESQQDGTALLRCVVNMEKLYIPPQPIRSMSRMAGMYTDSTRRQQTLTLEDQQLGQVEWVALGQDHALEQRILKQIRRQTNKG